MSSKKGLGIFVKVVTIAGSLAGYASHEIASEITKQAEKKDKS